MDDLDRELRQFFLKPNPVEEVIDRILNASPQQQKRVRAAVSKVLGDGRRASPMTLDEADATGQLMFFDLVDAALMVKEMKEWILEGLRHGRVTPETAVATMRAGRQLYDSLEKTYAPVIDALLKHEAKRSLLALGCAEAIDKVEDAVFRLELERRVSP